jgi:hypothetical protein
MSFDLKIESEERKRKLKKRNIKAYMIDYEPISDLCKKIKIGESITFEEDLINHVTSDNYSRSEYEIILQHVNTVNIRCDLFSEGHDISDDIKEKSKKTIIETLNILLTILSDDFFSDIIKNAINKRIISNRLIKKLF